MAQDAEVVAVEFEIETLVKKLTGNDPIAAGKAATQLGKLPKPSATVIEALVKALEDDRVSDQYSYPRLRVAWNAKEALLQIGQPCVPIVMQFVEQSREEGPLHSGLEILGRIGHKAEAALPAIEQLLIHESVEVRYRAIETLCEVQSDPSKLAKSLAGCMFDQHALVRGVSAKSLGELGAKAAEAVPSLVVLLDDTKNYQVAYYGEHPVRFEAARALGRIGVDPGFEALDRLDLMMRGDDDETVRVACAFALVRLSSNTQAALKVLGRSLDQRSGGFSVPEWAAKLVGKLGVKGRPCLPNLKSALTHPEAQVRREVVNAIAAVAPEETGEIMLVMAMDDDEYVQLAAIEALSKVKEQTDEMIEVYTDALVGDDEEYEIFRDEIRMIAIESLQSFGPRAAGAIPQLKKLAQNAEDSVIREAAAKAVSQIEKNSSK